MQSKELAEKLRGYANGEHVDRHSRRSPTWRGQKAFALFFADYLEKMDFSSREKFEFWRIEPHLPQIAVDAFEALRTGTDASTEEFRRMYIVEAGHDVPNITDLGASYSLDQGLAIQTTLGFMLRDILGQDWVAFEMDAYANAQKRVLQQAFDKFLRLVYRRGLYGLIDVCEKRGMSGVFGKTELRTYALAGRLMLTFVRKEPGADRLRDGPSVSFLAEDGDPLAYSAGIQSIMADFSTSLDMIEEVIRHWPSDIEKQKQVFVASAKMTIAC